MQKLLMVWLVGAVVLTLSPSYSASAQPTDENAIGARAKIAQLQALLDEEDEALQDDDLEGDQEDLDDQRDSEDDFEDQDDPEDAAGEKGTSGRWGTPT
jgi:hypothetical protein